MKTETKKDEVKSPLSVLDSFKDLSRRFKNRKKVSYTEYYLSSPRMINKNYPLYPFLCSNVRHLTKDNVYHKDTIFRLKEELSKLKNHSFDEVRNSAKWFMDDYKEGLTVEEAVQKDLSFWLSDDFSSRIKFLENVIKNIEKE